MAYKKLIIARIYDTGNNLIGCGVYSSRTKRTECKALKDVLVMLKKDEIDNMKLNSSNQIEGINFGTKEFNCLTAVRYGGGNKVIEADPRIYILSFDDKQSYPIIKPDGGPSVMTAKDILKVIAAGSVKPSNFKIQSNQIEQLGKVKKEIAKEQVVDTNTYDISAIPTYALKIIQKELKCDSYGRDLVSLPNGYNLVLENSRKFNGVSVQLNYSVGIEKYASPSEFPFIEKEYDDCYYIDRDNSPKHYDRVLNNAKNEFKTFNLSSKDVSNVSERCYLSIGDKRWLSANHCIDFDIPLKQKKGYTSKDINDTVRIIFNIIGRR